MIRIRHKAKAGFSLMELLVVVAIVGIMTALGLGQFGTFKDNIALTGFVSNVLTKTREAKALARARTTNVHMFVDLDQERVWLEAEKPGGGTEPVGTAIVPSTPSVEITGFLGSATGTLVKTGTVNLVFYQRGTSNPLGTGLPSDMVFHFGLKKDAANYVAGAANAAKFRTIMTLNMSGRAASFRTACVGTAAWASNMAWPECNDI